MEYTIMTLMRVWECVSKTSVHPVRNVLILMANFSIFLLVKENVLKEGVTILGKGGKKEYVMQLIQ